MNGDELNSRFRMDSEAGGGGGGGGVRRDEVRGEKWVAEAVLRQK